MSLYCVIPSHFYSNQNAISLVEHPPEIKPGTMATIVSPWFGSLCAVQLPNGEIHRWFASFELQPISPIAAGYARVISNTGHGKPPHIEVGTVVKIVRCIPQIIFYDVMINGTEYHRWLAEFEIAAPL